MTWLSLETMELERTDNIVVLTLTREKSLNAMSPAFFDNIKQVIAELAAGDHGIRALIITGIGGGFSVGADLKSFSFDSNFDLGQALRDNFEPMVLGIKALPFPTIAAVNGYCVGAGMGLMLACDLTIAARCANFAQGFVGIALVPDAGSTYFLPRLIGRARATEMMMLGENITADDALDIGLIYKVVDDDGLMNAATSLAEKLAAGPTSTIVQIRKLLDASQENTLIDQLGLEADEQKIAGQSPNFLEGVSAFLQKRKPDFK
tara:strand:- start:16030 stop:16818 length:789 start_codon:yes stop_codon:yes gene_type:complete